MQLIQQVIEQCSAIITPHAYAFRDQSQAALERICTHLERIEHAIVEREMIEAHIYSHYTVVPGAVQEISIPAGEIWELQLVTFDLTANGPVTIREGGRTIWGKVPAATVDNQFGNGMVQRGGATIELVSPTTAAGNVYLQWTRKQPSGRGRRFGGGAKDPQYVRPMVTPVITEHQTAIPAHIDPLAGLNGNAR